MVAFLVPLIIYVPDPIEEISTNSAERRELEIPVAVAMAANNYALLVIAAVTRETVLSDVAKTSGETE